MSDGVGSSKCFAGRANIGNALFCGSSGNCIRLPRLANTALGNPAVGTRGHRVASKLL